MRKIEKVMEMIGEWQYDARHELELEAIDKGLSWNSYRFNVQRVLGKYSRNVFWMW